MNFIGRGNGFRALSRVPASKKMILVAFIIAPLVSFLSSPLMPRLGVWYQSEPLTIGLYVIAMCCAIGLLLAAVSGQHSVRVALNHAVFHPVVLWPAAIFAWSVLMMPFIESPGLSFYGPPQTGIGAIWFFAVAVMIAAFRFLFDGRDTSVLRKGLAFYLLFAAGALGAIGVVGLADWRPFFYTDYLAFIGILLPACIFGLVPNGKALKIIAVLVAAVLIVISSNRMAFLGGAVMVTLYCGVVWRPQWLTRWRRLGYSLIPALMMLAVSGLVAFLRYTSIWSEFPNSIHNTVQSRSLMLDVIRGAIGDNPGILLFGKGWGMFSQTLLEQAHKLNTSLYDYSYDSRALLWSWDGFWRFDFDSHNLLAESLLSGGVIACIAIPIWLGSAIFHSTGRRRAIAVASIGGFATVSAFWFQMPVSAPFVAIALAVVSSRSTRKTRTLVVKSIYLKSVLAGLLIVFVLSGIDAGRFVVHTSRIVDYNFSEPTRDTRSLPPHIVEDIDRGQYHFAEIMKNYVTRIQQAIKSSGKLKVWEVERLELFMAEADRRLKEAPTPHVAIRALNTRADLAVLERHGDFGPAFVARLDTWGSILDLSLELLPGREDLALAYYNWLLKEGREEELLIRSEQMLQRNAASPIGLWFSGIVLLGQSSRAHEGMQRLNRALETGIDRFMPIAPTLREQILGAR